MGEYDQYILLHNPLESYDVKHLTSLGFEAMQPELFPFQLKAASSITQGIPPSLLLPKQYS